MGGGRLRASAGRSPTPRSPLVVPAPLSVVPAPLSVIPAPSPSFLRRQEPTRAHATHLPPIHPSPLPGGRLGGGWEVASRRRPLSPTPRSPLVIPAQAGTCAASKLQLPQPCYHGLGERKCDQMPASLRANRLRTSGATIHPDHAPNNPEQIRTNLNVAERSDQIGRSPGSPLNSRKKTNLNTVAAHSPSFLRRQEPTRAPTNSPKKIHPSPPFRGEARWGVGAASGRSARPPSPIPLRRIPAPLARPFTPITP